MVRNIHVGICFVHCVGTDFVYPAWVQFNFMTVLKTKVDIHAINVKEISTISSTIF